VIFLNKAMYVKTDSLIFESGTYEQLNAISDWVFDAIKEKAEREWGKPLRWEMERTDHGNIFTCKKCGFRGYEAHNFCPHCGVKLAPPVE